MSTSGPQGISGRHSVNIECPYNFSGEAEEDKVLIHRDFL
jgi:hypothetical protein